MTLDFQEDRLIKELKKLKPKRVLVQLPEGIKQDAEKVQDIIENLGIEVIFSGNTVWGGCSLAIEEAKTTGSDLIVHFGHAEFMPSDFPVLYIEMLDHLDLKPLLKKSLKDLKKHKKIGLSYSIQHQHDIPMIKKFYEDNGKIIIISKKEGRAAYEGHVVGCEYAGLKSIKKDVEAFLVIGNQFHSMGAALAVVDKPVYLLDVYNNDVSEMSKLRDKIIKQRFISIEKMRKANNVGVIVETKPGQKFGAPKMILKKLKDHGKKPFLIIMSEVTPDKIMNFYHIQAFVELACPRIAVDDFAKYPRPILTYKEAMVALDEKSGEDLMQEGFV